MANGMLLLAACIAVALVLWWRTAARRPARPQGGTTRNPYHCVEIRSRGDACSAVRRMTGKRFLSAEAPPLPLAGCPLRACRCVYRHFDDRRQEDRRNPYGSGRRPPPESVGGERRRGSDRRRPVAAPPGWVGQA
jgi:hypothetical protein